MNLAATREALVRFAAELPAGLHADRLQRTAEATRALIDQALAQRGAPTAWADHNLAVVVAEGLDDAACRPAALALFMGVRRRFTEALERDPDDLAPALALARGAAEATDDPRTAEDIAAVSLTLARPQAGPRLVAAAVSLVAAAGGARQAAVKAAAAHAAVSVRQAAERVSARLPDHPGAALDRVRLALLEARAAEGSARAAALSTVRGLLADHQRRFGDTRAARDILSGVLALEARGAAAAQDVKRDALALIATEAKGRTLTAKRAAKLVRTIHRAGQLDAEVAGQVSDLLAPLYEDADPRWFEARELLYEATGESSRLLTLWQDAIEADPKHRHAAKGLAERLMRNLREGLAAPFDNAILDRVLDGLSPGAVARWAGDDITRLLDHVSSAFGTERAFRFARDTLLAARELRKKDFLWRRALGLAEALGAHSDALVDIARRAVKQRGLADARLALARALIARGERLDEADDALRPLHQSKGEHAAEAQALKQKIKGDPSFRKAQRDTLLAYEHKLGIGSDKAHELKVVFIARGYVLAELVELPAPDFYEHKHLRTMIRAEDLPAGVTP
ncbi:MAG: hypothetical protein CSA66_06015, partial [Proteobacteria bacterium]